MGDDKDSQNRSNFKSIAAKQTKIWSRRSVVEWASFPFPHAENVINRVETDDNDKAKVARVWWQRS